MIFNQFEEFGNYLWHYDVTGHALEEVLQKALKPGETLRGSVFTTGSAGTIGSGDYLKEIFPYSKLGASEALQCPTLLNNGFGSHRIEGIGDKHVPWIHNVKNTDMVVAVDDEAPIQLIRLFNEPEGKKYLAQMGVLGRADRAAAAAGHLRHRQRAVGHQDGQVVRVGRRRRGDHRADRLDGTVRQPPARTHRRARRIHRPRCRRVVPSIPDGAGRGVHGRTHLPGGQARPQPEVLHVGRAAGQDLRGDSGQWYQKDYWTSVHGQADEIDALIEEFNAETGLL